MRIRWGDRRRAPGGMATLRNAEEPAPILLEAIILDETCNPSCIGNSLHMSWNSSALIGATRVARSNRC